MLPLPATRSTDARTWLAARSPGDDVTSCLPLPRAIAMRSAGADVSIHIRAGQMAVRAPRTPVSDMHFPPPPGFPVPQRSRRAAPAVAQPERVGSGLVAGLLAVTQVAERGSRFLPRLA